MQVSQAVREWAIAKFQFHTVRLMLGLQPGLGVFVY